MAATFEFNTSSGKIHYNAGMNEQGRTVRKVKTYHNVDNSASAPDIMKAFSQIATLCRYPMVKAEKVVSHNLYDY